MGLIHWWPLNGDLYDRGSNPRHGTLVGAGNVTTSGLFGKCLSGMSGSQTPAGVSVANCNLVDELTDKDYSFACWFKVHGTHVHYNGTLMSSGNWNDDAWAVGIDQTNSKIDVFNDKYNKWISIGYTLTNNKWYHLASIQKAGTNYVYLNGSFLGSVASTALYRTSATNLCIGRETYASGYFSFNGDICDVRIYDHALSALEVKELSRGLYIHYAFNDPYAEGTTNIDSCKSAMSTKTLTGFAGGSHSTYSFGNYFGYDCFKVTLNKSSITSWTGSYLNINPLSYGAAIGDTVTRSCWMYIPSGQTKPGHFTESIEGNSSNKRYTQYDFNKCDTWQMVSSTGTIADNGTNNYLHYFMAMSSGSVNFTFYIRDFQMEIKDHATPFVPTTRSSIFSDDSGNNVDGNGYKVELTTNSNSGDYAVQFDGAYSYIELPNTKPTLPNEPYTIIFWINPTENSVRDVIFGNHGNTSQTFNIERHTGNQLRVYYHGDSAVGYVSAATMLANTWTHIAISFDGSTCKVYKNGEEVYSKALSTTLNCTNANWKIGSDYRASTTTSESTRLKGKISDFRIYASGLSAEDIKNIYSSQAAVDKNNNIFTNEIIEQQTSGSIVNEASWEQGGVTDANGTDANNMNNRIRSKYIPVLPNTTYYYGAKNSSIVVRGVHYYDANNKWISYSSGGGNRTTPTNCAYVRWIIQNSNASVDVLVANIATYGPYMIYKEHGAPQGLDEGTDVQVKKNYTMHTKDICESHNSGFFIDGAATGNQFYEI